MISLLSHRGETEASKYRRQHWILERSEARQNKPDAGEKRCLSWQDSWRTLRRCRCCELPAQMPSKRGKRRGAPREDENTLRKSAMHTDCTRHAQGSSFLWFLIHKESKEPNESAFENPFSNKVHRNSNFCSPLQGLTLSENRIQ